jgi:hypothetical protein
MSELPSWARDALAGAYDPLHTKYSGTFNLLHLDKAG